MQLVAMMEPIQLVLPNESFCITLQNESEIADALEASKVPREDIFITSKIGPTQVYLHQSSTQFQKTCLDCLLQPSSRLLQPINCYKDSESPLKHGACILARDRQGAACMRRDPAAPAHQLCRPRPHTLAWRRQAGGGSATQHCSAALAMPLPFTIWQITHNAAQGNRRALWSWTHARVTQIYLPGMKTSQRAHCSVTSHISKARQKDRPTNESPPSGQ